MKKIGVKWGYGAGKLRGTIKGKVKSKIKDKVKGKTGEKAESAFFSWGFTPLYEG